MRYLLLLVFLTGCAQQPVNRAVSSPMEPVNQEMVLDKLVQPMSRNEVIVAVRECETNQLRAVMLYGKRKINGFTTDIVVDVTCAPKLVVSY